ncbi:MAG TPA: GDSL-type esterase/lipase family protein [Solirubrobacteraceae bacterium]|nr:GDSL-type esterase/lipase family protein [Solirubrobacteraceae bacterium]
MSGAQAGGAPCGLVALGDSITNGHGEPMLGVHPQSWAQWLAQALDVPFHGLASDGARAADVLREQVPRLRGPYAIGCVFVGVNDARSVDWDADAFARDLRAVVAAVAAVAARVALCTVPSDLGRPPAAPKPRHASAIVRDVAAGVGGGGSGSGADAGASASAGSGTGASAGSGASASASAGFGSGSGSGGIGPGADAARAGATVVVDLDDLAGPRLMLPDAVHPTALGQAVIAERAARALRASGVGVPRSPLALAEVDRSARARARWRARRAWLLAQDLRRRAVERASR